MHRHPWILAAILCALPALAGAQMPGQKGVFGSSDSRGGRDTVVSPSNPGVAPPLDIRIQGEGVSLPPGASEDDREAKQQAAPPVPAAPPKAPPPEAKKP
jgi:hypothetical protein